MGGQHVTLLAALVFVAGAATSDLAVEEQEAVARFIDLDKYFDLDESTVDMIKSLQPNMSQGFPDMGIPPLDPLDVKKAKFSISKPIIELNLDLTDLHVEGLSDFDVVDLHVKMMSLEVNFAFVFHKIKAKGNYKLDGKAASILPIHGDGPFSGSVTGFKLKGTARAGLEGSNVYVRDLELSMSVEDYDVHVGNLLGGGSFGEVLNEIVNALGAEIVNKIEDALNEKIVALVKKTMNKALEDVTIEDVLGRLGIPQYQLEPEWIAARADNQLDEILANLRSTLRNGSDPIYLPSGYDSYEMEVLGFPVGGYLHLFNGKISGLSTIQRTGPSNMTTTAGGFDLHANLGIADLKVHYAVTTTLLGLTNVTVGLELTASNVDLHVDAHIKLIGMNTTLNNLTVNEIGSVGLNLEGLSLLSDPLSDLVDTVLDLVKETLVVPLQEILFLVLKEQVAHIDIGSIIGKGADDLPSISYDY